MAKRPLLSANMRAPANALATVEGSPSIPGRAAKPTRTTMPEGRLAMPPSGAGGGSAKPAAADSLAAIFTDSFMTMSAASCLGWSQSFVLPLRLSSYLLRAGKVRPEAD